MTADPASAIQGTWQILRAELGGQPMPAEAAEQVEMEFDADTYTVRFGDEETDHGTYLLAPGPERATVHLTGTRGVNTGRTIPGILQVAGDRLRICYALEGGRPPERFAAPPGRLVYLATYRRKG